MATCLTAHTKYGLYPSPRGHEFLNLCTGFYGRHNYAFIFSQIYMGEEKDIFLRLYTFLLYEHIDSILGPEPLTQV